MRPSSAIRAADRLAARPTVRGAILRGAILRGAILRGAILRGATFRGALAVALSWAVAAPAAAQSGGRDRTPEPAAVRDARAAQRSFEFTRRVRLPPSVLRTEPTHESGRYGDECAARIGRLCWSEHDDDSSPPPEPESIRSARERLLAILGRAAAADSVSNWVPGQRVRYALEARRPDSALVAAAACRGTPTWCLALRGAALHLTNHAAQSAAAFDSADALRTPAERCAWADVSLWLEPGVARAYRRLPCGSPERGAWESRFWRLAQPLWMLPVNDLRNEWQTRHVLARVHGEGANPFGMSWGDDFAELETRYGWPVAWSTREPNGIGSLFAIDGGLGQQVVGHDPSPSYDFVPRGDALAPERRSVADVRDDAWTLHPSPAALPTPMRYAPRYAGGGVGQPTHQLARFRRGDSTLVVGAYDTAPDTIWSEGRTPPSLTAALLVLDDSGAVVGADRRDSVARAGVLVARVASTPAARTGESDARWLYGLEILQRDTVHTPDGRRVLGRALRARAPWHPLAPMVALSDLLVLRHSPGPTPTFEQALDSAAGSRTVRRGGTMGVYWEQYAAGTDRRADSPDGAASAAPDTIVIAATRLTRGVRDRLAAVIGRGSAEQPIALRFPDPGGAGVGRAIGLTWPDVPAGDYRLEVTLVPGTAAARAAGRLPATSALVVHIAEN